MPKAKAIRLAESIWISERGSAPDFQLEERSVEVLVESQASPPLAQYPLPEGTKDHDHLLLLLIIQENCPLSTSSVPLHWRRGPNPDLYPCLAHSFFLKVREVIITWLMNTSQCGLPLCLSALNYPAPIWFPRRLILQTNNDNTPLSVREVNQDKGFDIYFATKSF